MSLMKKTQLRKLKDQLWELCKELTRKVYGLNCYTCGHYSEHPHTGHFITDSICSTELSYDLKNLRPQCYRCNMHLSGNWISFEKRLIEEEGTEYINELKERNQKTKNSGRDSNGLQYDELWYENKINDYKKL